MRSSSTDILKDAYRLPVLDWNLCFFGGHSQIVKTPWSVSENSHLAFEVIYIISGQEEVKIENESYRLFSGDIIIIPPGFKHSVQCVNQSHYFCFHFDIDEPTFATQLFQNTNIYYPNETDFNKQIKFYLDKINQLIDPSANYNFQTKIQIQIFLSQLILVLNQQTKNPINYVPSSKLKYARIISDKIKSSLKEQILFYTTQSNWNLDINSIRINDIMKEIGISTGYGSEVFKEVFGMSPRKYLSQLKINEAKSMLNMPQLSISVISKSLGYQSVSHFSRQFKRWMNISPDMYRKELVFKKRI
jgi:AraC-like DNA-binding protein